MKKAFKIIIYTLCSLLILVLIAVGLLTTPAGENFVREKAVAFLRDKLKTEVQIGKLNYTLPTMIELGDVLLKDQQNDTMLAVGSLRVDISMLKLLTNKLEINKIELRNGVVNLYRTAPDTVFNFDYIAKAFSSPPDPGEKKQPTDTSGRMELNVHKLVLSYIDMRFNDYTGGSLLGVKLDTLYAGIDKIDPYHMDFGLSKLYVNNLSSTFKTDTSYLEEEIDTTTGGTLPLLAANELDLNNVSFSFTNILDKFLFSTSIHQLSAHPKLIDLNGQNIGISDFTITKAAIKITQGKTSKKPVTVAKEEDTTQAAKWRVMANTFKINGLDFSMDDENIPRQKQGIDYAHLGVQNLVLDAEKIWYTTDTIAAQLNNLSVKEQSGLNLKKLQTNFAYYPQGVYLNDLYLETDNTLLRNFAEIKYPSVDALTTNPKLVTIKINIDSSIVGMQDIILLAPQLQSQPLFKKYGKDRIKFTAIAGGTMDNLKIATFKLTGLDNTDINIDGTMGGLPDMGNLKYDLNIHKLQSTKSLIAALLPTTLLKQINPPNKFNITGHVSGTATAYNPNLLATTTDGNVHIEGSLSTTRKGNERYDLYVKADKLNIGKLLRKDTMMQYVTANVTAKGQSFDINKMEAMLQGEIQSAGFMGYNYSNITFDGNIANKEGTVNLVSKDPNAALTLEGQADFNNKYPAIVAKLVIDSTDLQALKFSKDPFKIHADINADFPELNPDYPNGTLVINKPIVNLDGKRYVLDSLYIASTPNDSGNYIVLNLDVVQGVISGRTPLSQIGNIVQSHINRHYQADTVTTKYNVPANYDLAVKAIIVDKPLLHILLPGLKYMDTIKLDAGLTPNTLFANVKAPKLQYNDMGIYNINAAVKGADSALTYNVNVDRFSQNNLQFWYASVGGNIRNKEITTRINIADSAKNERFSLGAVYNQARDTQKISINNPMKLNYKDWQVSTPNAIVLGKDGLYVQNFRISSGGESISINSEMPQFSAPMVVAINDFMISNITEIISKDTLLANGVLNSKLRLQNITTDPEIAGTLGIKNLSVLNDTIGNLDAELKNATTNQAEARIAINGRGNDVVLTGFYYPKPSNGNNFDLDLKINAINLKSMEGLAMQQINNSSGYIKGNLKIKGTMTKPVITGELRTDNLQTTVGILGAPYKMPAERIVFTKDAIEFDNFKIVDENGKSATIGGKIITTNLNDLRLDMNLRTRKFQALKSEKKQDQLFYGKLLLSSNLNINGTPSAPKVDGSVTIHDSTDFTVVIPKQQAEIEEREGIVKFVDMDDTGRNEVLARSKPTGDTTEAVFAFNKGTDINVNLAIEKQAVFNVIIDEGTGDFLSVKGDATLNTAMRPDGTLGITGKYELTKGFYELNYNLIKRRFEIQEGSAIIFTGDPLTASVDITAVYTANIPPYDLVEKQVSDPAQLVYYKQRLPFQVKLKLSGEIMKPEIAFDITLPENKGLGVSADVSSLVEAKLNQIRSNASELNKQVFAVLILNRFISDNPFESGTSTSAEFIARQSVSRFISEQLNNLAKDLVGGINLSVDLESSEDYSTGQKRNRTDLNVAASKRLLNDRLTITVGNNFGLEGQNQTNQNQNTSLIPGNLAADYQLSRDGRYMVRLYRKNENTDILEGYVIETGASFIVTLEYNRFKSIFINRKKQIRKMREARSKGASN